MEYFNPEEVLSPRDFIEMIEVVHDGGENGYSIARIRWEGEEHYAIRWNVARREWDDAEKRAENVRCVGMPSSHGYPVWFLLPNDLLDTDSDIYKKILIGKT